MQVTLSKANLMFDTNYVASEARLRGRLRLRKSLRKLGQRARHPSLQHLHLGSTIAEHVIWAHRLIQDHFDTKV